MRRPDKPHIAGYEEDEALMDKVRCTICGWEGTTDELAVSYQPNPKEPGDVIPEVGCPHCGNEQGLENA